MKPYLTILVIFTIALLAIQSDLRGLNEEIGNIKVHKVNRGQFVPQLDNLALLLRIANIFGINPNTLIKLAECESEFNKNAWNKNDPNDGSKGLFQYQSSTFYSYAQELGIKNPNIWNVEQQILLTSYLIAQNKLALWTCGQRDDIKNR